MATAYWEHRASHGRASEEESVSKKYIDNYLGSHKSKDRLVVGEMEILDEPTFTVCGKEFCGAKSLEWLEEAVKEKLEREKRCN